MKDTARLIITMNCNRSCPDCCNKTDPSIKLAEHIKDLSALKYYEYVCITGGEPLLCPDKTLQIIKQLKYLNPDVIIYLYTALRYKDIEQMLPWIDGIHYTLHYPESIGDLVFFYWFQAVISNWKNKSFRLCIDNRVRTNIAIHPNVWHRVEIKPWMKECSLPNNEKLFILEK